MMRFLLEQALLWPVLVPLSGSALCAALWRHSAAQRVSAFTTLIFTCVSALLLLVVVMTGGAISIAYGGWEAPFGISFVGDHLSAIMVALTGVLALVVAVYSLSDVRARQERGGYHPLLLGLVASVNGAFLTGDLFNLYVWLEIMLITAMALMALDRTRAQLDGTFRYAVLNLLSTLLVLLSIAIIYGVAGTLNMADLSRVLADSGRTPALAVAAVLLFVGFGIKAGYFPLFFWLPASYHTGSSSVLAIFAGLLTKVGVYGCYRVFTLVFEEGAGLRGLMMWLAAGTMLFGVLGAAVQWDVRRILSFHIISQIGYMLLGLAIGSSLAVAGAIFYIVHHIIVKANLFLIAGAMKRVTGTFDLRKSGGLSRTHPLLALLFAIPALSLAGIPPFSGFWAKYLVIDATLGAEEYVLAALGLFVGLLTIFSMSKIWLEGFWKASPIEHRHPRRLPIPMRISIAALGAITVCIGLWPEPLIEFSHRASVQLFDPALYLRTITVPGGIEEGSQ